MKVKVVDTRAKVRWGRGCERLRGKSQVGLLSSKGSGFRSLCQICSGVSTEKLTLDGKAFWRQAPALGQIEPELNCHVHLPFLFYV